MVVVDREERIEVAVAESQAFDLGRQTLALLQFDLEKVAVFIADAAVDRNVQRNDLRLVERVVRLDVEPIP